MWMLRGNPSAQWHDSLEVPLALRQDKETTQLHSVLIVSEFLLVSRGLDLLARIISRRRVAKEFDFSRGIDG